MRGFFLAAISLAVLEAAVSSPAAAGRAGVVLALPGTIARYIISPTVPAIPELRKKSIGSQIAGSDNPFAQAALNAQLISATWSTQSAAPTATPAVATAPLSPTTIGA
jgi:hypothetical protein